MKVYLDGSLGSYHRFLRIKSLPRYEIHGRMAWFPDEYAADLGVDAPSPDASAEYVARDGLFDYQRDIVAMAIAKQKMAIFADCGLGKTLFDAQEAVA